jgi:uncharacterized RDD family membrane protein YckC
MKYAKIWLRIGGGLIDLIIVAVTTCLVTILWGFLVGYKGFYDGMTKEEIDNLWTVRALLVGITIDFLYTVITQAGNNQATFGQRASDLILVKSDGTRASALRVMGRYFASIFSSIFFKLGYVVAIFTKRKQTIHDLLTDTVVIEKDESFEVVVNKNILQTSTNFFDDSLRQIQINSPKDFILIISAVAMLFFGVYVLVIKFIQ